MRFTIAALALASIAHAALDVDITSIDSIKKGAKLVAQDLFSFYHGNEPGNIPGMLPGPPADQYDYAHYYWWEAGAMWGTFVDYWHVSGDDTYNAELTRGVLWQADPPANSFMPINWTLQLGNDDQSFWAMTCLLAAEVNFPNPPPQDAQWLALAQAVFNLQQGRWDETQCKGGLNWQIIPQNPGFEYKNTISNAIFFNMGVRLARYTGNDTYAKWAVKAYDWMAEHQYFDKDWNVYDGARIYDQCVAVEKTQFSYNTATILQAMAFMYNYTTGADREMWKSRVTGLVNRTLEFYFLNGTMVERPCEFPDKVKCNIDQQSFKGYMLRWLASSAKVAPFIRDLVYPVIQSSVKAGLTTCTAGNNGRMCGFVWTEQGVNDGRLYAGPTMNMLAGLISLLYFMEEDKVNGPLTNGTGGTSVGNPDAGISVGDPFAQLGPLRGGNTAGAAIATAGIIVALSGLFFWMGRGS